MAREYDIASMKSRLQSRWSGRDTLIQEMRDLRYMEHQIKLPEDVVEAPIHAPMAYQIIETMVGVLTADPMTISVPPMSSTDADHKRSNKLEKFLNAAITHLCKQAHENVPERFIESLLADGHGCMRVLYVRDMWKDYPSQEKGEADEDYSKRSDDWRKTQKLPIAWNYVDPLNAFPEWNSYGQLTCMVENDFRDVSVLRENFEGDDKAVSVIDSVMADGGDGSIEFTQVWTPKSIGYSAKDEQLQVLDNELGECPYVYAYGFTTNSRDYDKRGLSVLFPIREILPYLDTLLVQKSSAVRMTNWPTWTLQTSGNNPTGNDGRPRVIEVTPGGVITLHEGEKLEPLQIPDSTAGVDEMMQVCLNFIERAGLSSVMSGMSGGASGYALNQLIGAARSKFKPIIEHAENAIEEALCLILDIIEYEIDAEVYLYDSTKGKEGWLSLGPDDIRGCREVHVNLNPIMPTDKYANSSRIINEVKSGLLDRRSAVEALGNAQPDEVIDAIYVDRFKEDPRIQQLIVEQAAKRAGLELQPKAPDPNEMQQQFSQMVPAAQQAFLQVINGQQGGNMPTAGRPGQQEQTAPPIGVTAGPNTPAMPMETGRRVMPSGIASGQAPGTRRGTGGSQV